MPSGSAQGLKNGPKVDKRSQARAVHTVVSNGENPPKISSSRDFTSFSINVSAYSHHLRFRSLHALHIENLSNRMYDHSVSQIFQSYF